MVEKHTQNFFGQKTAIIVDSNRKDEPCIYVRCLKKKKDGEWQNFSESKVVKFSLLEMIAINDVLNGKRKTWNTFHAFNEVKTPISFAWDEHDFDLLWINIDDYSRPLNYPETELLRRLMDHLVEEKIASATCRNELPEKTDCENGEKVKSIENNIKDVKNVPENPKIKIIESKTPVKELTTIESKNKNMNVNAEKAILVQMENNEEIWLPKSTILSSIDEKSEEIQNFTVKAFVFNKK
jgi:hypothetical protein